MRVTVGDTRKAGPSPADPPSSVVGGNSDKMLPSERNERLVKRIGLAICIAMAIYILIWLVRFISGTFHRALEPRVAPFEEGAAHWVEVA